MAEEQAAAEQTAVEQTPVEQTAAERGTAEPPSEPSDGWRRVHPLTPAVRSWQMLVVLLLFVGQDLGQSALGGGWRGGSDSGLPDVGGRVLAGGGLLLLLVLLVAVAIAVLSWRMTRYRVTREALELHQGILFRQQRQARLDRLQAVDVVQPLVARIFGLARLTLEVAGGSDSKVELSYLTDTQARQLRNHLLASAAGLHYDTAEAPEAPEEPVLEVPVQRLLGALALSGAMIASIVVTGAVLVATVGFGQFASLAGLFPMLLGTVGVLWQRFNTGFGFTLGTSPDGLRIRRGLLEHRAQTLPPGRVQAVRVMQPLLWRGQDWWRVQVNVAGYGKADDAGESVESVVLPVGTRNEAATVMSLLLPDLGITAPDSARAVLDAGLQGTLHDGGFTPAPPQARWLDPWGWPRVGFRVTGQALLLRRGRLYRVLDVVPHARTQSCGVRQGSLQRRLGLATFALHSTPGPVSPAVAHISAADAGRLLREQSARAAHARRTAGPERWMEAHAAPAGVSDAPAPPEPAT